MNWLEPALKLLALLIAVVSLSMAVDDWRHDGKDKR